MGMVGALRGTTYGLGRDPTLLRSTLNYSSTFLVSCVVTYLIFALGGLNYHRSRPWACGFLGTGLILRLYTESVAPAWTHLVRAVEFDAWLDPPLLLVFYLTTLVLPAGMFVYRLKPSTK